VKVVFSENVQVISPPAKPGMPDRPAGGEIERNEGEIGRRRGEKGLSNICHYAYR
jgi:hypothetical protein